MHIIDKIRVRKNERLNLSKIFREEHPKRVVIVFDTSTKRLYFIEVDGKTPGSLAIDSKKRISLPRWVKDDCGEEFYLDEKSHQEHYLLPTKFFPLE